MPTTTYTWEKDFFSTTTKLFNAEEQIGTLIEKTFSTTDELVTNGQTYKLHTKGFLIPKTDILDASNQLVGQIRYNGWRSKANVEWQNQIYVWQLDNFWSTRWSLHQEEDQHIYFNGTSGKGNIQSTTDDAILMLCGLFIARYYKRNSSAV